MLKSLLGMLRLSARSTLAAPSPELFALFGARPASSGMAVTPESAMRCPAVYACVKVISESVSQVGAGLFERSADGSKTRASDHPLDAILHDQANEWTSAAEFRLEMQTQVLLHGNAYAFINRSGGRVSELIPLPSTSVTTELDLLTMEPRHRVTTMNGVERTYGPDEIFHLRTFGARCSVGDSPISQAKEAIGLAMAMESHAAKLFGSGARPSGVFKYAKTLGPDALKRLSASFSSAYAGGANSGKTLVLEDGMGVRADPVFERRPSVPRNAPSSDGRDRARLSRSLAHVAGLGAHHARQRREHGPAISLADPSAMASALGRGDPALAAVAR